MHRVRRDDESSVHHVYDSFALLSGVCQSIHEQQSAIYEHVGHGETGLNQSTHMIEVEETHRVAREVVPGVWERPCKVITTKIKSAHLHSLILLNTYTSNSNIYGLLCDQHHHG